MKNEIIEQVKKAIREPFAWPGGYPVYVFCADGLLLCRECAKDNFRRIVEDTKGKDGSWQAMGAEILWEGEEYCAHCSKILESAYGEKK